MRKKPFTLVELLTTIGVIAILAGILLPAVAVGKRIARKSTVQNKINTLKLAITQYKSSYGVYPVVSVSENIASTAYQGMLDILAGGNTRKINFLKSENIDLSNLILLTKDEWTSSGKVIQQPNDGNNMVIYMDVVDYNNQVVINGSTFSGGVFIYSYGPNGANNNGGGDDICSWKN